MKEKNMDDEEIKRTVAGRLVSCRKEKGLTQAELAKEIRSNPTTVATWEQGKSMPSIMQLLRLAKYYEKSISFMYGEEEKKNEKEPILVVYQGEKEQQYSKEDLELIRDVFQHGTLPGVQEDQRGDTRNPGGSDYTADA